MPADAPDAEPPNRPLAVDRASAPRPADLEQPRHEASTALAEPGPAGLRGRARAAACAPPRSSAGASLYYAFPVMLPTITRDTGWSPDRDRRRFSAALIVSALAGIPVGHLIDRTGPRWVMTVGSVARRRGARPRRRPPPTWSSSPSAGCSPGWRWPPRSTSRRSPPSPAGTAHDRVRALTTLTLAGGLASTIFAPITAALTEPSAGATPRSTLAVIVLVTAVAPARVRPARPLATARPGQAPARLRQTLAGDTVARATITPARPFLLLAAALTLSGFAMYAVVFGLIPLLTHRGATTSSGRLGPRSRRSRADPGPPPLRAPRCAHQPPHHAPPSSSSPAA